MSGFDEGASVTGPDDGAEDIGVSVVGSGVLVGRNVGVLVGFGVLWRCETRLY